ncbi:MAG: hypothetical protein ACREIT_05095 [Tepidisphaeraceae bacterium]
MARRLLPILLGLTAILAVVVPCAHAAAPEASGEFRVSPDLREVADLPVHGRTMQIMLVLLQLAALLAAAKLMGALAEKIKVPASSANCSVGVDRPVPAGERHPHSSPRSLGAVVPRADRAGSMAGQ